MEEIEVASWLTLDALKKAATVVETVGNLQTGHSMSVFCRIEEDYLELHYSDSAANYIRCYEEREEFQEALKERKEEVGEAPYDDEEDMDFEEDKEEEEEEEEKEKEENEEYEEEGEEGKSEKY
jgi:Pyruvate/2-oxoacid:ferredoxin oxidoreductase gamma subunit